MWPLATSNPRLDLVAVCLSVNYIEPLDSVFSSIYQDNNSAHPQGVVRGIRRDNDCMGRTEALYAL